MLKQGKINEWYLGVLCSLKAKIVLLSACINHQAEDLAIKDSCHMVIAG